MDGPVTFPLVVAFGVWMVALVCMWDSGSRGE